MNFAALRERGLSPRSAKSLDAAETALIPLDDWRADEHLSDLSRVFERCLHGDRR